MGYLGLVGNEQPVLRVPGRPLPNGLFRISWKLLRFPSGNIFHSAVPFLMGYLGLVGNRIPKLQLQNWR